MCSNYREGSVIEHLDNYREWACYHRGYAGIITENIMLSQRMCSNHRECVGNVGNGHVIIEYVQIIIDIVQ